MEVSKAQKIRRAREKKAQEKIDLAPAQAFQRRGSSKVPYNNVKSGVAEQGLIAMLMRESALLGQAGDLRAEEFSVPLFAKVYTQIRERVAMGLEVSLATLTNLTDDEMSHMAGIVYQQDVINENAFRDCVRIVRAEHQSTQVSSEDDLMAIRQRMKERKGLK
jgi:DNA primase